MTNHELYEMSEEDIDKTITYLKSIDPDHATAEDAIAYLEYYQEMFHKLGHILSEDEMRKLYDEFASKRHEN